MIRSMAIPFSGYDPSYNEELLPQQPSLRRPSTSPKGGWATVARNSFVLAGGFFVVAASAVAAYPEQVRERTVSMGALQLVAEDCDDDLASGERVTPNYWARVEQSMRSMPDLPEESGFDPPVDIDV